MITLILALTLQTLTLTEDPTGLYVVGSCGYSGYMDSTGTVTPVEVVESDTLEFSFVEMSGTVHFVGIINNDMDSFILNDSTVVFVGEGSKAVRTILTIVRGEE